MFRWIKKILGFIFKKKHVNIDSKNKKTYAGVGAALSLMYSNYVSSSIFSDAEINRIVNRILNNKNVYINVSRRTNVPWEVISVIHYLEGGLSFKNILHNGERLPVKKTRLEPKGRGPFDTWDNAAVDALEIKKGIYPERWTIGETLNFLEKYNGLGYRKYHKNINSPYLWSGTKYYKKGKYVADGKYNKNAVSKQVGAVVLLKKLMHKGEKQ